VASSACVMGFSALYPSYDNTHPAALHRAADRQGDPPIRGDAREGLIQVRASIRVGFSASLSEPDKAGSDLRLLPPEFS